MSDVQGALTEPTVTAAATSTTPETASPTTTTAPEGVVGETALAAKAPEAPAALTAADLALPEGLAVDDATLGDFLKIVNDGALDAKGRSEALLGMYAAKAKELAEGPVKAFRDVNEQWQRELRADPEIGGDKLQREVLPAVAKVIDRFGGDKFRSVLDLTGAGNNPEMARFLWNVAKALNEGSHVGGTPPNTTKAPPSAAAALYPNLVKEG